MTFLRVYALCAAILSVALGERQVILVSGDSARDVPGDSIVRLCPESSGSDLLAIERLVNQPPIPYLNDEQDVLIWGNFTQDISVNSTVDYQINATANTGDFGALNGTFHICDYLEKMRQPPDSNKTKLACPPTKGPVFIDYAVWFADILVAPGQWSVRFDAKTPNGDRIYCLETTFDLQCPPGHDGPECLRDVSHKRGKETKRNLEKLRDWMSSAP